MGKDLKKELEDMVSDKRLGIRAVNSVIVPIIERYIKDTYDGSVVLGNRSRWDIYVKDGFGDYKGDTVFDVKCIVNCHPHCEMFDSAIQYVLSGNQQIKNLIFIIIGDISKVWREEFINKYASYENLNVELWDFDKLIEIISLYPWFYGELLTNARKTRYSDLDYAIETAIVTINGNGGGGDEIDFYNVNPIDKGEGVLFFGAGISFDAGIPGWGNLIGGLYVRKIDEELSKRGVKLIEQSRDDIIQNLLDMKGSTPTIQARLIKKAFAIQDRVYKDSIRAVLYEGLDERKEEESETLKVICEICKKYDIRTIITYNYDNIVERALERGDIRCNSIYESGQQEIEDSVNIYHVHGYLPKDSSIASSRIIFSEDEYHELMSKPYDWANMVQIKALMEKRCVFVGLSMTDPNLRRLLDMISQNNLGGDKRNQVILSKEGIYVPPDGNIGIECFNSTTENLHTQVFEELGVEVAWVDVNSEIPMKLRKIFSDKGK